MTAVDVFFVKNDMLEKPDKSKEKAEEQSKENNKKKQIKR